jgi:hypothetical protein
VWLKAEFPGALAKLRFEAVVEHNRSAQPYLLPGKNQVTVTPGALGPGKTLSVTYAYQEATVADPAKRTRFEGQGVSYGPTKTVSREAASGPVTFTLDVGGNTPPKMISLEMAVAAK